jgi:hypothetical protein
MEIFSLKVFKGFAFAHFFLQIPESHIPCEVSLGLILPKE